MSRSRTSRQTRPRNWFWRLGEDKPQSLSEDIHKFSQWMSPTKEEEDMRERVKKYYTQCICEFLGSSSRPVVFGSSATGLFSPLSDVDIVVLDAPAYDTDLLFSLAQHFERNSNVLDKSIRVISEARVPLIKFIDKESNLNIDICFGQHATVRTTSTVKDLLEKYPKAKDLFVVVKYLLFVNGLNEVYTGGIGSYALLLMIVGFLQQKDSKKESIGELLKNFFLYYGMEFNNKDKGISIADKSLFDKESRGWFHPRQPHMLSIEDPSNKENDVTRSSWNIRLIQTLFQSCYRALNQPGKMLESIFPPIRIPYLYSRKRRSRSDSYNKKSSNHISRAMLSENWRAQQTR